MVKKVKLSTKIKPNPLYNHTTITPLSHYKYIAIIPKLYPNQKQPYHKHTSNISKPYRNYTIGTLYDNRTNQNHGVTMMTRKKDLEPISKNMYLYVKTNVVRKFQMSIKNLKFLI